ncbi:hypothetical protein ATY76_31905 [Rhizobium sp. R339]|nr:hypothetical protein ATY76_31905 [Rhizobium sp. R339]
MEDKKQKLLAPGFAPDEFLRRWEDCKLVSKNAKSPLVAGYLFGCGFRLCRVRYAHPSGYGELCERGATIASEDEVFAPAITAVCIFGDMGEGKIGCGGRI